MRKVGLVIVFWFLGATAWAQSVTIAALGDSLVHGFGLVEDDGFVPQMQAALGSEVRLINAGVSGDTTAGGAARVDWTLGPEVQGMIVVLGGNDMLRGIDPAVVRANLEQVLQSAQTRGVAVLLVGMQAPGNYGADYKTAFDAAYPELATKYGALLYDHFFAAFSDVPRTPEAMQAYMQPDGIHPNKAGVARIVADMTPSVEALIDRIRSN